MSDSHIKWTMACSVGCEALDADHQQIFAACDALRELVSGRERFGESADYDTQINQGIKTLSTVLYAHFAHEESRLAQCSYPDLENHRELHQDCAAFFETMLADKGSVMAKAAHIEGFIKGWIFQHILVDDMRYKPWLHAGPV